MNKTVKIPQMLTITQTVEALEGTGITRHFIRQLCLDNKICYIKAGSKYLINFDKLIDYLNGENTEKNTARADERSSQNT